ncbi:MAG: hypothetical protein WCE45_03990 [Sedimentisphaerales bacterium]
MSSKRMHLWNAISLIAVVLTTQGFCASDVNNGGFELYELYEFNEVPDINVPIGWQHENYADVVGNFIPHPAEYQGQFTNWRIDTTTGLFPFEGEHFLVISTGDVPGVSIYAKVQQSITIEAGDKLTGVYFFGTCDYISYYPEFNDWAEIKLVPADLNFQDVNIVHVDVNQVGSIGAYTDNSMSGWKRFEYTFDVNQAGTYDLTIFVSDYVGDDGYDTYFAVDGLVLCHDPLVTGDFSCDCTVNFQDLAIFVADWLCNCNDPNIHNDPDSDPALYNDPNTNCLLGTDLTGDGPVNFNDLQVMSEYWLEGTKEE